MTPSNRDPQVGKAVGKIPSGVYVLAAIDDAGTPVACLVSWVQQAAFEPLSVTLALGKDRVAHGVIQRAGAFALSVLADGDKDLMKRYVRGLEPGEDPFEGLRVGHTPTGLPFLADALAWIECRVTRLVEFGADHDLVIAAVTAGEVLKQGESFTHLRGSGWRY